MESLIAAWPYITSVAIPLIGWLWKRVQDLELSVIKSAINSKRLDDLEAKMKSIDTMHVHFDDRIHELEIVVARIDSKLDMILDRVRETR